MPYLGIGRTFYFVGGPLLGDLDAFFGMLVAAGGPPPGWQVYHHVRDDGLALHVVRAESETQIHEQLERLGPEYGHGPIIEVAGPLARVET